MTQFGKFVFDPESGEVVPKHLRRRSDAPSARSDLPRPFIRSDSIAPGISQLSGKMHDTMSGLKQDYREYESRTGKKVEIVGDQVDTLMRESDRPEVADEKAVDAAIKTALEMQSA